MLETQDNETEEVFDKELLLFNDILICEPQFQTANSKSDKFKFYDLRSVKMKHAIRDNPENGRGKEFKKLTISK